MKYVPVFRNPWWVVFGATLGMIVGNTPMILFTSGLFLKPITEEFGWSRSTFAGAIFVSQVAGAISMPLIGRIIDRWGIRPVTLSFVALFSLATVLLSQTRSVSFFVLLYGICGLAGSGRGPIAYTKAISASFESRRGVALGMSMTGLGIGAAVIPQLVRLLMVHVGWRGAYVGLGIIAFAVSFPTVALFIHEPGHPTSNGALLSGCTPTERPSFIRSAHFWFLAIAVFLVSASLNGTFTHIVPLLTDRGVSVRSATSILSISAVALMGGQLASGYLLDRFPAKRVAGFFFLLALIGIVSLSLETGGAALLGGTCLAIGIGAEGNLAPFLVSRYFGLARFSEIFGYILAISVLANGAGPWLIARSYDIQGSYSVALGGSAVALILASLLIFGLGQYPHPAALILSDKSRPVRL